MKPRIDGLKKIIKEKRANFIKKQLPENKDFSNMDLSHFNLRCIEPEFWENAIFYNTNFSNTGIRFFPNHLVAANMINCNFENVDLGYLSSSDFSMATIRGCNFKNTNLHIDFFSVYNLDIRGVQLDYGYSTYPQSYWEPPILLDVKTIELNPFIRFSSLAIFIAIMNSLRNLRELDIKSQVQQCEEWLEKYDDGSILQLYNIVKENGTISDCLKFFKERSIKNIHFSNITFGKMSSTILDYFDFEGCTFSNVTFEDLDYSSWKNINHNRIGNSVMTFKRNLYLELGSNCNCNCSFCRNNSFDDFSSNRNCYNLDKIKENLSIMAKYLDTIFIGGGEPTLRIKDISEIYNSFKARRPKLVVVTNGSLRIGDLVAVLEHSDSVYISRHAISDEENLAILNPSPNTKILSLKDLKSFSRISRITLSPVCIKNGLDTSEKIIEYISTAFEIGVENVLISTLHQDASYGSEGLNYGDLYVSPIIFEPVKQELLNQGYIKKPQICSTGGYLLDIFTNSSYNVIFKEYINKQDEQKLWFEKCKRTFDLSMTPNGDVFENWRQDKLVDLSTL